MDLGEKLLELRKSKNLTQEELAEALYVSRTAISKWESGRGYPSIDSLKEISKFFSVTIDELLSVEKILSIAERENKSNIRKMCNLILGIVDMLTVLLILLPLYPNPVNGYIYSVNLLHYVETTPLNKTVYWILFLIIILLGCVKIILTQFQIENGQKIVTGISMGFSIMAVLFLGMAREPYALTVEFLLLIIKGVLLFKFSKNT